MSTTVDLADLPDAVRERGPAAFLVTIGETRPHVVAVLVTAVDGRLEVGAGRRTAANVAERPTVTLLWPDGPAHPANSLLVDGTAQVSTDGERLAIEPTGAILHRTGGRDGGLPC